MECECGDHAFRPIGKWGVLLVDVSDFLASLPFYFSPVKKRHFYARSADHVYLHRVLSCAPVGKFVDHANGNGLDDRRKNLRICSNQENLQNLKKRSGGTSRYKGVSWEKRAWVSRIKTDGRVLRLGLFSSEKEAAICYDKAAKKFYGQFASTNADLGLV